MIDLNIKEDDLPMIRFPAANRMRFMNLTLELYWLLCYSTKCHTYAFFPWHNPFLMLARLFPKSHLQISSKKHSLRAFPRVSLLQHMDINTFPHCNPWMPSFLVKNKKILMFLGEFFDWACFPMTLAHT